jgi:transposase-like protein
VAVSKRADESRARVGRGDELQCPRCASAATIRWGSTSGLPRFRCRNCARTFNLLTNTGLARLRHREKWLTFVGTLLEHKSIRDSAAVGEVNSSTALRWRHRLQDRPPVVKAAALLSIMKYRGDPQVLLSGLVDTDPELSRIIDLLPILLVWLR